MNRKSGFKNALILRGFLAALLLFDGSIGVALAIPSGPDLVDVDRDLFHCEIFNQTLPPELKPSQAQKSGRSAQSRSRREAIVLSTKLSSGQGVIFVDAVPRRQQKISDLKEKIILHRLML